MNELQLIGKKIISLPGRPLFMLDRDVAELYETETRSINQAVKRNPDRFPEDFCFQLDWDEAKTVIKMRGGDIFKVTDCDLENDADGRGKNIKYLPYAFTREGCNMLSAVLSTPVAVQRSIQIMRAFTAMERFSEGQRVDRFVVDAPDTPLLPSGLQMQALIEIYGKEETKQILQDYFGIHPGGPRSSITPLEARIIQKGNPNKRRRDEVIALLRDRGVPIEVIVAMSGMCEKSIRMAHYRYRQRKHKDAN